MRDLALAIHRLDRVPDVLGIRYEWPDGTCVVMVLRDRPVTRLSIARVMARFGAYRVSLVPRSEEHIAVVERLTAEARAGAVGRTLSPDNPPAHAHRQRKRVRH